MGLEETEAHGLHVEEHDGSFMGYRTVLIRYPTERLTVSVLCNTTEADADSLGEAVSAALLPQLRTREPSVATNAPSATSAAFGFDFMALGGTYIDPSTAEVRTLGMTDGVLSVGYGKLPRPARELIPVGRGDLLVKGRRTHYTYEGAKGQKAVRLVRVSSGGEAPQVFVRSEPVDKVEKLTEYAGRFGSDELPRDLEIRIDGSRLVAGPPGGAPRTAPFTPVARDLFVTDDVGWRFERDARHRIVRLVVSTDRARDVVLVRR